MPQERLRVGNGATGWLQAPKSGADLQRGGFVDTQAAPIQEDEAQLVGLIAAEGPSLPGRHVRAQCAGHFPAPFGIDEVSC